MIAVHKDHGPFRRWLRWLPEHAEPDPTTTVQHIYGQLKKAMDKDDTAKGTGERVGLWVSVRGQSWPRVCCSRGRSELTFLVGDFG